MKYLVWHDVCIRVQLQESAVNGAELSSRMRMNGRRSWMIWPVASQERPEWCHTYKSADVIGSDEGLWEQPVVRCRP